MPSKRVFLVAVAGLPLSAQAPVHVPHARVVWSGHRKFRAAAETPGGAALGMEWRPEESEEARGDAWTRGSRVWASRAPVSQSQREIRGHVVPRGGPARLLLKPFLL